MLRITSEYFVFIMSRKTICTTKLSLRYYTSYALFPLKKTFRLSKYMITSLSEKIMRYIDST